MSQWFKDRRQEFIAATLRQFGQIRRADLMREFDVSLPQASNDIATFLASNPPNVTYDVSGKTYVLAEEALESVSAQRDVVARYCRAVATADHLARRMGGRFVLRDQQKPAPEIRINEPSAAARDVLVERRRQIERKGWTPEHDDEHWDGSMAQAAAAYAYSGSGVGRNHGRLWPWHPDGWKPTDRRRDLVKAGALILAEIERLDRAAQANTD